MGKLATSAGDKDNKSVDDILSGEGMDRGDTQETYKNMCTKEVYESLLPIQYVSMFISSENPH